MIDLIVSTAFFPLRVKSVLTCVDSALQLFSFSHTEVKFGLKLNVFRRLLITREIREIDSLRVSWGSFGGSGVLRALHCLTAGFCWGTLIVCRRALWLVGSENAFSLAGRSYWANFDIKELTLPLFRRKISSSILSSLAPSPTYDFVSLSGQNEGKKVTFCTKKIFIGQQYGALLLPRTYRAPQSPMMMTRVR